MISASHCTSHRHHPKVFTQAVLARPSSDTVGVGSLDTHRVLHTHQSIFAIFSCSRSKKEYTNLLLRQQNKDFGLVLLGKLFAQVPKGNITSDVTKRHFTD
jgi:hypothetical protein